MSQPEPLRYTLSDLPSLSSVNVSPPQQPPFNTPPSCAYGWWIPNTPPPRGPYLWPAITAQRITEDAQTQTSSSPAPTIAFGWWVTAPPIAPLYFWSAIPDGYELVCSKTAPNVPTINAARAQSFDARANSIAHFLSARTPTLLNGDLNGAAHILERRETDERPHFALSQDDPTPLSKEEQQETARFLRSDSLTSPMSNAHTSADEVDGGAMLKRRKR